MKPLLPLPDSENADRSPRRLHITAVYDPYSQMTVGFEIHDGTQTTAEVVHRLVAKHGMGPACEFDSTTLDIWVTPK